MKWFNPPKTFEIFKKRIQISLLMLNLVITSANLILVASRLDRLGMRTVYYCQMDSPVTSICLEQ